MINRPVFGDNNAKNGVIKVQTRELRDTLGNKAIFIPIKVAIAFKFVSIEPTKTNDISVRMSRNKLPSMIGCESIHLIFHSRLLVRITNRLSSGAGSRRAFRSGREIENLTRLKGASTRASDHMVIRLRLREGHDKSNGKRGAIVRRGGSGRGHMAGLRDNMRRNDL